MPRKKLTPEQVAYVEAVTVPGVSITEAYRIAYPLVKQPANMACKLMKLTHIQRAIEIKTAIKVKKALSSEDVTQMISERTNKEHSEYMDSNGKEVQMLAMAAKSHGLLVDKTDNVHRLGESEMAMAARIAQEERQKDKTALEDAQEGTQKD